MNPEASVDERSLQLDRAQLRRLDTGALLRHALWQSRLLARSELLHAKAELLSEVQAAKRGGVLLGLALGLGLCGLSVLFAAVGVGLPLGPFAGLVVVGAALCLVAAVLVWLGKNTLPRKPLPLTQARLREGYTLAREQLS